MYKSGRKAFDETNYMKSKTLSFNHRWKQLGYTLLLFPHLKPESFEYIAPQAATTFDGLRLVSIIIILALYLYSLVREKKLSGIMICIILYQLTLFISTLYNGGDYWSYLISAGNVIAMSMLVELMLKRNPLLCFNVILIILEILVYANLLTILLYPNGMYIATFWQNWLLGYDNVHIGVILPALMIALLRDNYNKGNARLSLRTLLLIAASYTSIFVTWPATAVMGLAVLAFFIMFSGLFRTGRLLNCFSYVMCNIVFLSAL